jgi:hypothetical protein
MTSYPVTGDKNLRSYVFTMQYTTIQVIAAEEHLLEEYSSFRGWGYFELIDLRFLPVDVLP